jgi:hypothetical protein
MQSQLGMPLGINRLATNFMFASLQKIFGIKLCCGAPLGSRSRRSLMHSAERAALADKSRQCCFLFLGGGGKRNCFCCACRAVELIKRVVLIRQLSALRLTIRATAAALFLAVWAESLRALLPTRQIASVELRRGFKFALAQHKTPFPADSPH